MVNDSPESCGIGSMNCPEFLICANEVASVCAFWRRDRCGRFLEDYWLGTAIPHASGAALPSAQSTRALGQSVNLIPAPCR